MELHWPELVFAAYVLGAGGFAAGYCAGYASPVSPADLPPAPANDELVDVGNENDDSVVGDVVDTRPVPLQGVKGQEDQ